MANDILAKIDTLIEMSKSTSNYETLKAELKDIQDEIENKKREIEDLRLSMHDEKYVKASDRIIDENIKVSLELKIQKLEANLKKANSELKKMVEEEENSHQIAKNWKEKVRKITKLLEILKEKLATSSDQDTKDYYQKLITENEEKLAEAKRNVTETEEEYHKTSRSLTDFTKHVEELKEQLKDEKSKLVSTTKSLETNDAYIDFAKKAEDEKRLENLKHRLEDLKNRQDEILKDAAYVGNNAKELYIEDDRTGCLLKVKELVDYLKTLPFMDIPNSRDVERILNEAEETSTRERDEFASFIDNKKYEENDTQIIEERKHYLESQKQSVQIELEEIQNQIKIIDLEKVKEINGLLSAAIVVSNNLKNDLTEYTKVIEEEKENATPKKKAVLTSAYKKKEEELALVEEIINAYENEMQDLMIESRQLEETEIPKRMEKMEKIDRLLKDISKKTMITSSSSDVLSLENDKAKLKELNNQIKTIAERRKYQETPSEIFDFIEMSLGALMDEPIEETEEENLDNFRITEDIEESEPSWNRTIKNKDILSEENEVSNNFEEVIDIPWTPVEEPMIMSPLEPSITEEKNEIQEEPNLKILEPSVLEEPQLAEIKIEEPPLLENTVLEPAVIPFDEIENPIVREEKNTPVSQRLKVINVEDLNEETKEENSGDDILIGDFKDDDYIDFDSIMGGAQ